MTYFSEAAAALAEADEALLHHGGALPCALLRRLDGEDRVPVGREDHRGGGDGEDPVALAGDDGHVAVHPGAQAAVAVREGGPDADVPGGDVHLRVDGGDVPVPA